MDRRIARMPAMKCLRFLAIFLMGLATAALASPNAALAEPTLPGEPCEIEPPRDSQTGEHKWTPQERWAWKQICEGREADFNQLYGVTLDPKEADGWNDDRKLRSSFLETILLHEPFRGALTRKGVRIIGAWFLEPIDLENANLEHELRLDDSRFDSTVNLRRLETEHGISLEGSKFTDTLDMEGLQVEKDLFMRGGAKFAEVRLVGAKIGGQLAMNGSKFAGKLDMNSLEVNRRLFMHGGAEFGQVILVGAKIDGQLSMIGSKFTSTLDMNSLEVGGSLFMRDGAEFGEVDLRGAKIGGYLDMVGSKFTGTLKLNALKVEGSLLMKSSEFSEVILSGAEIETNLDMEYSRFNQLLNMDSLRVGGHLNMHTAEFGEVVLNSAEIGGILAMYDSNFTGNLQMDKIQVDSSLFMQKAEFGRVIFNSAEIGGQLVMDDSKFADKLEMVSLQVVRDLYMRGKADFREVDLRRAKIGDHLSMTGSTFTGVVDMDSLEVGGSLSMRGAEFAKQVNLIFASIGSNLDLSGAKLKSLDLTGTQITGELRFGSGQPPKLGWELILRNTVVNTLQDREESWKDVQPELDGFTYSRLGGFGAEAGPDMASRRAQWFIKWLAKDESFSPQPYQQLASVLRAAGRAEKADDILYAGKERERTELAKTGAWASWLWSTLKLVFIGHGYRIYYALFWVAGLVVLGAIIFRKTKEAKEANMPFGIFYSFDMLLPIIKLREKHYEIDFADYERDWRHLSFFFKGTWRPARYYFYMHQLMGYVLASFLIAGLSGLTK
jgi:uncharacterized protein YjbI with pentapeptide repeats